MFGVRNDSSIVRKISSWALKHMSTASNVVVKEIQCKDLNCVPVETILILFDGSGGVVMKRAVLKPMNEVTEQDIVSALIENNDKSSMEDRNSKLEDIDNTIAEYMNGLQTSDEQSSFLSHLQLTIDSYKTKLHLLPATPSVLSSSQITTDAIQVSMKPKILPTNTDLELPMVAPKVFEDKGDIDVRHKKGSRPRGCPCCDPDNIDNVVDKYLFLGAPL
jgi:hypothetical protein